MPDYKQFPVIRFELEGMRTTLHAMLTEHQAALDADIKTAVDAYLTPENIQRVIHDNVVRVLDQVIREEVERFYRYGNGRQSVKDYIVKFMDEQAAGET